MHYIAFLKYKAMGAQLLLIDFQMTCKCILFHALNPLYSLSES